MSLYDYDFGQLCQELYDPQACGVVVISEAISKVHTAQMCEELKENQRNFVRRPFLYGTTQQLLESWDFERAILQSYRYLSLLDAAYAGISNQLHAHFETVQVCDRVAVNASLYPVGSVGIGPHRDNTFSVNFTVIFVLSGNNDFYTAQDKCRNGELAFRVHPGDAIVMRAPRSREENDLRPVHYVKQVNAQRYVVVFREINHQLLYSVAQSQKFNA